MSGLGLLALFRVLALGGFLELGEHRHVRETAVEIEDSDKEPSRNPQFLHILLFLREDILGAVVHNFFVDVATQGGLVALIGRRQLHHVVQVLLCGSLLGFFALSNALVYTYAETELSQVAHQISTAVNRVEANKVKLLCVLTILPDQLIVSKMFSY